MAGIPPVGRVLALDWGTVRTGVALSDETQLVASPLGALHRRPGKRFPLRRLLALLGEHKPVGVVVGLPLTADGEEGESARGARALADEVERRSGLPVELWDERLSTARVLDAIREQGGKTRGRKGDVDSLAATVLLQHWLEARRSGRLNEGPPAGLHGA